MLLCPLWGPSELSRAEWFLHLHSLRKWLPSLCLHTDNCLPPQHSSHCTLAARSWFYPTHPVPHIHATWPNLFISVGLKVDVKSHCCRLLKQASSTVSNVLVFSSIHFSSYVNSSTGRSHFFYPLLSALLFQSIPTVYPSLSPEHQFIIPLFTFLLNTNMWMFFLF